MPVGKRRRPQTLIGSFASGCQVQMELLITVTARLMTSAEDILKRESLTEYEDMMTRPKHNGNHFLEVKKRTIRTL